MSATISSGTTYLCVCLNPVIQKTIVIDRLVRGEVNRTSTYRTDIAGKGLIPTRVLGQLGEKAVHLTQLGGPTRDWYLSMAAAEGLDIEWVESGAPIRMCTTIIERQEGEATELVEEAVPVAAGTSALVTERFASLLSRVDVVMLSGTVAAGFEPGLMGSLAALAAGAGKRLYLDIKGKDLMDCLRSRPVCVKPNLEELAQTMGVPYASVRSDDGARRLVADAGREFYDRYGCRLVVTRGSRSTIYWDGQRLGELAAPAVSAVNPIGSGDSFGVGLARTLERGCALDEAVAEGNRLGALNATRLKPGSILSD